MTNGDSDDNSRRTSAVGDLASALKNKLSKGNKQPPTPPKKDFLTENETREEKTKSGHSEPGRLQIPAGFSLPGQQMGLKMTADRSSQPPPPAPPANRSMQPPPPPPPTKMKGDVKPPVPAPPAKVKDVKPPPPASPVRTSEDPKPCLFGAALKPTPPKKIDTKTDNKPKPPSLPMKPHNEKPKPMAPLKHNINDNKPKVPVKTIDSASESDSNVAGMASALKAKFDNDRTAPKPFMKPKPPSKTKVGDSERTSNVAGLADVLKARFEASGSEKPETQTQKPNVSPKVTPPPPPVKKPVLGNPGIPSKPRNSGQAPQMPTKPAWIKNSDSKSPPPTNKPSWAKNNSEIPKSRTSEANDDAGAHKVSDLANVLKAKFENRQQVGDTSGSTAHHRESKPVPPGKTAIKPFQKPARPSTPPSPRSNLRKVQNRRLPSPPIARSSSPGTKDNDGLDPKKYSSRPLPPQPNLKTETTSKQVGKAFPALPVKPKASSPLAHLKRAVSSESSDSEEDSKPVGVSNLANVLKAKLGSKGAVVEESSYLTPADEAVINNLKNDSDIENNNVESESSSGANLFTAIADFAGQNDGEIRLVQGQQVELLETAEGWSYVSIRGNEGWVPSTYIEKVQSEEPGSWTGSQSFTKAQTVFRTNSEFIAENDGELNVSEGQDVNVLDSQDPDWWFVETEGNEGWIPASYIDEVTV